METNRNLAYNELFFGCILLIVGIIQSVNESTKGDDLLQPDLNRKILDSSVQIRVYNQDCECYSLGLGTVFNINEKQHILTHNHWSTLSPDSTVVFYDWQKTRLLEISGREYLGLILYQDAGSLILQAPDHLGVHGFSLMVNQGLIKDDRLLMVLIDSEGTGEIKVTEARVLAYTEGELPGYAITPLSDEEVDTGDSGAGIWHEDQLLGNIWSIILQNPPVEEWEKYQVSFVARFPTGFERTFSDSNQFVPEEADKR